MEILQIDNDQRLPHLLSNDMMELRNVPIEVEEAVQSILSPVDLETHPFLVGWYNELVGPRFALDYPPDTLCLTVISGPAVFEKAVLPYIRTRLVQNSTFSTTDPLDESMKCVFQKFEEILNSSGYNTDIYHDFELHHTRRPKVLVQTAAHVAGAVEYVVPARWNLTSSGKKFYGVAVHPKFGGWFAIRGIVVLKNTQCSLEKSVPLNLVQNETLAVQLLEEFSYRWKENVWRDVVVTEGIRRYSKEFIEYLEVHPEARWEYVKSKEIYGGSAHGDV